MEANDMNPVMEDPLTHHTCTGHYCVSVSARHCGVPGTPNTFLPLRAHVLLQEGGTRQRPYLELRVVKGAPGSVPYGEAFSTSLPPSGTSFVT